MKTIKTICLGIALIPLTTIFAQDVIKDESNASGSSSNEFVFRMGDAPAQNYFRGITIGNITDADFSTNLYYRGAGSGNGESRSFNVYGRLWNDYKKVFSLNSYGNAEFSEKVYVRGSSISLDHEANASTPYSRFIMARHENNDQQNPNRWLVVNPNHNGVNDFIGGTFINSKVAISTNQSWWTAPKYANNAVLSIDGLVYAEGLKIKQSSQWPDYVFKTEYDLKSLNEVEQFINTNGYLPGVPSALEVEKEGLDVGEMQKIQMEKIEELTLHAIELNKKNHELAQSNESLDQKNQELELRLSKLEAILLAK